MELDSTDHSSHDLEFDAKFWQDYLVRNVNLNISGDLC